MAKITYEDKEFLNKNENIADKNKVNDTDLNEIKEVVNGNDDNIGDLSDLNTSDKSSLVNAINYTLPTILYENANGSNGNITLNDSVKNYRYIEVYYRNNDNRYNSKKFYKINGKYVVLDSYYSASNDIVWKQQTRLFDGKQFNVISNAEVSNAAISHIKTSSNTFVMLIIGYK